MLVALFTTALCCLSFGLRARAVARRYVYILTLHDYETPFHRIISAYSKLEDAESALTQVLRLPEVQGRAVRLEYAEAEEYGLGVVTEVSDPATTAVLGNGGILLHIQRMNLRKRG